MESQKIKKYLTVSNLAYILDLSVGTVKAKLDNYQLSQFIRRHSTHPAYAILITEESAEIIKKVLLPKNRPDKAVRALQRFETWLETGEVE